jgi:hypothetical protein
LVVLLGVAGLECGMDSVGDGGGGPHTVLDQDLPEAVETELIAGLICGFENAIASDKQGIRLAAGLTRYRSRAAWREVREAAAGLQGDTCCPSADTSRVAGWRWRAAHRRC